MNTFRYDLSIAKAVFYIGYSAYDIDIKRILAKSEELKSKSFFIIGKNPKGDTERKVSRFGNVLKINTDKFALKVESVRKNYEAPTEKGFIGYCIEKVEAPERYISPSDPDIFDLVMYGKFCVEHVWSSISNEEAFICLRDKIYCVINELKNGIRVLVITSELGNGKSLFLEGLKYKSLDEGYNVYSVNNQRSDIIAEIDQISQLNKKTLLLVDDYPDYLDAIDYFHKNLNSQSACILTARNPINDIFIDKICTIFDDLNIQEFNIDKLSENESEWFINYFEQYGLWGKVYADSELTQKEWLNYNCKNEIHAVLLKLFESPFIMDRFKNLMNQIMEKKDFYEVIVGILVLTTLNYRINLDVLMDVWGNDVIGTNFRRNIIIRQLIDFEKASVKIRSAVAAKYILSNSVDTNIVTTHPHKKMSKN